MSRIAEFGMSAEDARQSSCACDPGAGRGLSCLRPSRPWPPRAAGRRHHSGAFLSNTATATQRCGYLRGQFCVQSFALLRLGKVAQLILATSAIALTSSLASAADAALVTPFSAAPQETPPSRWRLATVAKITRHTDYRVVSIDGERVLRMAANASYANLLYPLERDIAATPVLRWRWRVDRLPTGADLTHKRGDDVAARVCVLFDVPPQRLSFGVRAQLALGRALFDPKLPAAAICYVWDGTLAADTWLANAYTDRVMMRVQRGKDSLLGAWYSEARDLAADFAAAFPYEATREGKPAPLPPVAAIVVSGDADNTGSQTLAFMGDLELAAPPAAPAR
jgi:hypothetical protein